MNSKKVLITVFGGIEEIGGNKILIDDAGYDVKVFLDFGKSFEISRRYYESPYARPSTIQELISLGSVPDIANLYTVACDITRAPREEREKWKSGEYSGEEVNPPVDAVFVSHAHLDHYGYISLLNRKIPIYLGECAERIVKVRMETSTLSLETNYLCLNFKTFRSGNKIRIHDLEIEPVHVDHSVPGAYGFLIHSSEGIIVYTGDFRMHGHASHLTQDFKDRILDEGPPEVLICEGTHSDKSIISDENEVRRKISQIAEAYEDLIIADFNITDFDRFRTFLRVARETRRDIVLSTRQYFIFSAMNKCRGLETPCLDKSEDILVLDPQKKRYSAWERELLEKMRRKHRIINYDEIRSKGDKYVFCTSIDSITQVKQLRPPEGSLYILSTSEPFNEEKELSFEKLLNWLEFYGLSMIHVHASGHAGPLEIRKFLKEIRPRRVIPVHTEKPMQFKRYYQKYAEDIIVLSRGHSYAL